MVRSRKMYARGFELRKKIFSRARLLTFGSIFVQCVCSNQWKFCQCLEDHWNTKFSPDARGGLRRSIRVTKVLVAFSKPATSLWVCIRQRTQGYDLWGHLVRDGPCPMLPEKREWARGAMDDVKCDTMNQPDLARQCNIQSKHTKHACLAKTFVHCTPYFSNHAKQNHLGPNLRLHDLKLHRNLP